MESFSLTLKNEKLKLYNRFSIFIIIILTLLYIYTSFFTQNNTSKFLKISVPAFMALGVFARGFLKNKKYPTGNEIIFFFLVMGWASHKLYWLACVTFLLAILFSYATKEKTVFFNPFKIIYPSLPGKKIRWNNLNNCLLKDGLLTIDFKNNKIIQQLIDERETAVNEKEFNDFCSRQLKIAPSSI